MSGIHITHLRLKDGNGNPINKGGATLAYRAAPDGSKEVEFALSMCGPKDHFNTKVGHDIAHGRLLTPRPNRAYVVAGDVEEFHKQALSLKSEYFEDQIDLAAALYDTLQIDVPGGLAEKLHLG